MCPQQSSAARRTDTNQAWQTSSISSYAQRPRFCVISGREHRIESEMQPVVPSSLGILFNYTDRGTIVGSTDDTSIYRDKTIFITDLGESTLSLLRTLPISVEYSGGQVVACSYDLEELTLGSDDDEVVADMKSAIVDLYYLLKDEQENLGPLPRAQWEFLKGIIREK